MRARRALSLIEVVLAMVILGVAVPPLLLQISASVQQQETALIEQNLVQLASERMWAVFTDHADPTHGYDAIVAATYPDETAPNGLTGYVRRTEIREVSPDDYVTSQPGSGIKRLRVTVTGPRTLKLTVESFVTDIPGAGG
jgi:prepilin-type N-terminal cleavage/methylation domain-containing protein